MTKYISIFLFSLLLLACSSTKELQHPTESATNWVQNAAEYDALTTLVYRTAADHLDLAYQDSYWTALPRQEKSDSYQSLPAAVIMDVDETVLDNSPFQVRMIKQNSSFSIEAWNRWVKEATAKAVPGALSFARYAAKKGITIFYITNREHKVEEATRKNLNQLGFPLSKDTDVLLTQNELKSWTDAKTNRRAYVAKHYRVLMLFGDDLNDFAPVKKISKEQRNTLIETNKDKWGNKWFILPNPIYGSWESAL